MTEFDDSELIALAVDLPKMSVAAQKATTTVFREAAQELTDKWRANAKETSGKHGRLYPASITWQQNVSTNLDFEVGPETNKPQGGMGPGFEFGSVNQRPHLDGQRAADVVMPGIEHRVGLATAGVFGA